MQALKGRHVDAVDREDSAHGLLESEGKLRENLGVNLDEVHGVLGHELLYYLDQLGEHLLDVGFTHPVQS